MSTWLYYNIFLNIWVAKNPDKKANIYKTAIFSYNSNLEVKYN